MKLNSNTLLAILAVIYTTVIIILSYMYIKATEDRDKYIELYNSKSLKEIEIVISKQEIDNLKKHIDSLTANYKKHDKNITNITNVYETKKSNVKHLPVDSIVRNLSKWVSEDDAGRK